MTYQREAPVQNAVLTWLNLQYGCFAWRNNTVGVFDPIRKVYLKPNSRFHVKGAPDILAVYKGRFIGVECKSPTGGRLSEDQILFAEKFRKCGGLYIVAKSINDVVMALGAKFEAAPQFPADRSSPPGDGRK